jgi:hypothetical protein
MMTLRKWLVASLQIRGVTHQFKSGMPFLWVKLSMTMKEKLRQVRSVICINRREITHTLLQRLFQVQTTLTASYVL